MVRNSLLGALVFGVTAALAGYVWTAFEFPFAIILPAFVGWYVVVHHEYGNPAAWKAALVGGVSFTAVFMVAVFFALTDGSPVALTGWMAAALAAAVAGAVTGFVVERGRGALTLGLFTGLGMLLASAAAGLLRAVAPGSVDVAGTTQYVYFALVQGVIGMIVGAAAGAGVSWLARHAPHVSGTYSRPHPVA